MLLSAIIAMSENKVIGKNNSLPWHLPADLKHFKDITLNHSIIMGRKTFDSIGKALPQRKNIVISRDSSFYADNIFVFKSLAEALKENDSQNEVFIIGGAQLIASAISSIQKLYLTIIHEEFEGDVFFNTFEKDDWKEIHREDHVKDAKNAYDYSFLTLARK